MANNPIITLSHYDRGPMQVQVWDEATWWMKRRTWTCPDDPELGSFDDADFDEHYSNPGERIDDILAAATSPNTKAPRDGPLRNPNQGRR